MEGKILSDRERTNILKTWEFQFISYLCAKMPPWITPDRLTLIGIGGAGIIFLGLYLGQVSRFFLIISIIGLAIHWFGDSLDGRLAYFRNIPRKWYGFSVDLLADWVSVVLISLGAYFYLPEYKFLPSFYVVAYGALMFMSLLRYKITDEYSIDAFHMGPTEMRIVIAIIFLIEIFIPGTLTLVTLIGGLLLMLVAILALRGLIQIANERDAREMEAAGGV